MDYAPFRAKKQCPSHGFLHERGGLAIRKFIVYRYTTSAFNIFVTDESAVARSSRSPSTLPLEWRLLQSEIKCGTMNNKLYDKVLRSVLLSFRRDAELQLGVFSFSYYVLLSKNRSALQANASLRLILCSF